MSGTFTTGQYYAKRLGRMFVIERTTPKQVVVTIDGQTMRRKVKEDEYGIYIIVHIDQPIPEFREKDPRPDAKIWARDCYKNINGHINSQLN